MEVVLPDGVAGIVAVVVELPDWGVTVVASELDEDKLPSVVAPVDELVSVTVVASELD